MSTPISKEEEIWKKIPGIDPRYEASDRGRIRENLDNGSFLVRPYNYKGYIHVYLKHAGKPRTHRVHRLVAMAFLPNPLNKPQVNHIDGVKDNNLLGNLEWATATENTVHMYNLQRTKTVRKGASSTAELLIYGRGVPKQIYCPEDNIVFHSLQAAGEHYGLHKTSIRELCRNGGRSRKGKTFQFYAKLTENHSINDVLNKKHREYCRRMGTTSINPADFPAAFTVAAVEAMKEYALINAERLLVALRDIAGGKVLPQLIAQQALEAWDNLTPEHTKTS